VTGRREKKFFSELELDFCMMTADASLSNDNPHGQLHTIKKEPLSSDLCRGRQLPRRTALSCFYKTATLARA
jgi:hypothetical protein